MKHWWEESGIFYRFSVIENKQTYKQLTLQLPEIKNAGFNAIEVLPPYHGGNQYGGLDVIDFYNVDPRVGTLEDLHHFLKVAHDIGFKVIGCINIGYAAVENPDFIKACKDVRNNVNSRERDIFIWSDSPDRKFHKPDAPYFLQDDDGEWVFNEVAGKYFWCKWRGFDGDVRMPQYNFASVYWQEECKKIINFWLKQGYDGFMIDAVNWYINCNWEINEKCIIEPAYKNGPIFLQPEGGSGFKDDPEMWISKGKYTNVQDYSLEIWWEKDSDVIGNAKRSHDTSQIWEKILYSRNRVVASGGTTYMGLGQGGERKLPSEGSVFEVALLFAIGEQVLYYDQIDNKKIPSKLTELFFVQQKYKALSVNGKRERIDEVDDKAVFAIKCIDIEEQNHIYAVINFAEKEYCFIHPNTKEEMLIKKMGYLYTDTNGKVIF